MCQQLTHRTLRNCSWCIPAREPVRVRASAKNSTVGFVSDPCRSTWQIAYHVGEQTAKMLAVPMRRCSVSMFGKDGQVHTSNAEPTACSTARGIRGISGVRPGTGRKECMSSYLTENEGWRRGSGSNRRIRVLQTLALPLGYRAITEGRAGLPLAATLLLFGT